MLWDIMGYFFMKEWVVFFFNLGIWMWMDRCFGNDGGWGR